MSSKLCTICSKPSAVDWQHLSPVCQNSNLKSFKLSLSLSEWESQTAEKSAVNSTICSLFGDNFETRGDRDHGNENNLVFLPQHFCVCCHERVGEMCKIVGDVQNLVERLGQLRQLLENSCKRINNSNGSLVSPNTGDTVEDSIEKIRMVKPEATVSLKPPKCDRQWEVEDASQRETSLPVTNFSSKEDSDGDQDTESAASEKSPTDDEQSQDTDEADFRGAETSSCHHTDLDYSTYKEKYKLKDVTVKLERLPKVEGSERCTRISGANQVESSSQKRARSQDSLAFFSSTFDHDDGGDNNADGSNGDEPRKLKKAKIETMEPNTQRSYMFCGTDDCKFRCLSAQALEAHSKQMHGGILSPYSCSICKKSFRDYWKLERHRREVHQRVKSFKCELCERSFVRLSHLTNHMATHSDVRNFSCPSCPQKFKHKKHLTRHIRCVHAVKSH